MSQISAVVLEGPDPAAAETFYADLGVGGYVITAPESGESSGFRAFTLSLVVSQPGNVDSIIGTAIAGGATVLKPAAKGFWGYGGVVRAPDGSIWKVATSAKKDTGPAVGEFDDIVLLLGVADVKASKRFYVERGLSVGRSFGGKYAEFESAPKQLKLALYPRKALAKDAGVPESGSGSHRIRIDSDAGSFADPDGFEWANAGLA